MVTHIDEIPYFACLMRTLFSTSINGMRNLFSGPKRYDYVPESDDWRYSRDGMGLGALLDRELTDVLGTKVSLHLEGVSTQVQEE